MDVWTMVPPTPVYAASITVTTTTDEVATNGNCSLREALINANADLATQPDCPAGTGVDVITLTSGSTYTLTVAGVLDTNGDLDITDPDGLTIQASGATPAIIDGGDIDRVIEVSAGDLTLNTIIVTNGTTPGYSTSGGGIRFAGTGTLNVIDSVISNNVGVDPAGCGGGIYNNSTATVNITNSTISGNTCSVSTGDGGGVWKGFGGNLTITNSTISGNSTGDQGGGVRFSGSGTLTITDSTISNNTAGGLAACGGGVYNSSNATVEITNSTIANNTCAGVGSDGGGLWKGTGGTLNITNSTFYGNSTNDDGGGARITAGTVTILFSTFSVNSTTGGAVGNNGGGLQINNATVTITSSILANNAPHDCDQSGTSTVTLNNTLIGVDIDCGIESFNADPGLGPLANNGGPTQTMAITGSSVAFNAATSCGSLTTDQRGIPRPQKSTDNCDLGAFELQVNDEPDFTASNPPAVDENAGAQIIIGWVTSVTLGPADESGQSVLGYIISNSTCGTLLSAGPSISTIGTLTYTPAASQNGTCTFDAQVQDDGGKANGGDDLGPLHNFTITVNDTSSPTVTVEQGSAQSDPTSLLPIDFDVVFSEPINPATFTTADITQNGTATGITWLIINSGDDTNFTLSATVSGLGTLVPSIAANTVQDTSANNNNASTSVDNSVTFDSGYPIVLFGGYTVPDNGASFVGSGPTQITVEFSEDVKNDGSAGAANTVANYLLVEDGINGTFDTVSCVGGLVADDTQITVNSASYANGGGSGPFVATLNINGGVALTLGSYRLFVCGTTSIEDLADNGLNNRVNDTTIDFTVQQAQSGGGGGGSGLGTTTLLPATGFPHGQVTSLSTQPSELSYASYSDLWLEIPKLGIKMSIVGVPQTSDGWDVTWLNKDAGWLNGSAFPTWNGNSVITGHVWDALNRPGPFAMLKTLKYGDQVRIHAFGQVYTYEIQESQAVLPTRQSTVFQHEDKSWITLVTCEDYQKQAGTYAYRRMVRAVLVSVKSQ